MLKLKKINIIIKKKRRKYVYSMDKYTYFWI